ncbi:MAG TPA: hemerythrin family protein [Anaeromyxobacteraceae bacterium]|nr:hemerythrin family protein [Anaeromyxobacteraceae bacterium]
MPSARELGVGHELIDAEHRVIVRWVGELRERVDAGDAAATAAALAGLWDATVGHFASEEAIMEEFAYPERRAHAGAHQLFLGDLKELISELSERGLAEDVAAWAKVRVPEWITFHIETNDAPLARFVQRRTAERLARVIRGEPAPAQKPRDA